MFNLKVLFLRDRFLFMIFLVVVEFFLLDKFFLFMLVLLMLFEGDFGFVRLSGFLRNGFFSCSFGVDWDFLIGIFDLNLFIICLIIFFFFWCICFFGISIVIKIRIDVYIWYVIVISGFVFWVVFVVRWRKMRLGIGI